MKKLMLTIAAVFCLSAVAVQAQDPQKKDTTQTQNYREDMTVIKSSEIPATSPHHTSGCTIQGMGDRNILH